MFTTNHTTNHLIIAASFKNEFENRNWFKSVGLITENHEICIKVKVNFVSDEIPDMWNNLRVIIEN